MKWILASMFLTGAAFGGDAGMAAKSAIVPGMGQIAAGRGEITSPNTWKGLAIMGGFVFSAHNAIQFLSRQESYAEETQVRSREREEAEFFEDKQRIDLQWSRAFDNYETSRNWVLVFSGLTAAIYGYGIVDAFLFTKGEKRSGDAGLNSPKTELRMGRVCGKNGVEVLYRF